MGGGLRQAQGHRGKAHTGQLVPLREVVALRPEDRAVEEGLGPLPGQDHAEGAGASQALAGPLGRRRPRSPTSSGWAPDLASPPAADMRERLARHLPARWREAYALAVVRAVREPAPGRSCVLSS